MPLSNAEDALTYPGVGDTFSAINSTQDPHALPTVQPRTSGLQATRKF